MGTYGIIIIVAIVIVVFFLAREFWCWFWKINERISLMEKQNEYFRLILKNQKIKLPEELNSIKTSSEIDEEQKKCNDCGNMVNIKEKQCPNCGNRDFSQI
jgi:regulatory protein YycI of two-component signal transduction system YycFG